MHLTPTLITLLMAGSVSFAQQPQLSRLTDDVYLFNVGFHSNIFVVTPEGVIATDPISPGAAEACLKAIRSVTDQPVRYLIYSHDHTDHIAGGTVFKPDATIVAHRSVPRILSERGVAEIVPPDVLVDDFHRIELGGKVVELHYLGRIESESNLLIYLPADRVVMWVDAVRSYGVPFRYLEGTDLRHFRRALKRVQELDFDHLVHGHGPATDKEQVRLFDRYFSDLDRYARLEMAAYTQLQHRDSRSFDDPQAFFDSYIALIAGRLVERMRPRYGEMGGFESWGPRNAERMVVFLLHELPFGY